MFSKLINIAKAVATEANSQIKKEYGVDIAKTVDSKTKGVRKSIANGLKEAAKKVDVKK